MSTHLISPEHLSLTKIEDIIRSGSKLALSDEARTRIEKCYAYLHRKIASSDTPIYGINTGFGSLYDKSIAASELSQLQENLVKSHACGMGEEVPAEIVKLMLLLKIQGLALGHSGVALETVQRLVDFYNHDVLPVVYQQGSLGASGDLAPLAHLSLPLIGLGEVRYRGQRYDSTLLLRELGWNALKLQAKEGLALLNGTQFMSAYGTWIMLRMQRLSTCADIVGALSLDAFDGRSEPFHPAIQTIRPHSGQAITASNILTLLEGSELIGRHKTHVQDPYSFRCIPQVHGASKDTLRYAAGVIETELNSVTDNPTIFPDEDRIISAGNFHGQPLALVFDMVCIAVAELGSISERRIYKLISGQRALPPFLVANPGLNSGFMIPQYTAASIVSQNKQLCTPSSIDTIDSSNGQEDHVSMGANGAVKAFRVVENLEKILGIELLNAAQAIEFREPALTSPRLQEVVRLLRKTVPFIKEDQYMRGYMENARLALEAVYTQAGSRIKAF